MIDSGSPISFLDFKTAHDIVQMGKGILRPLPRTPHGPKYTDFNGNEVKRAGTLTATLRCGAWFLPMAEFNVLQPNTPDCMLLGADLMPLLGLSVSLRQPDTPTKANTQLGESIVRSVNHTNKLSVQGKTWAVKKYPELFFRTGRAANHIVKTEFKTPFVPTQQKGRRVPVALQSRVETELKRLIAKGHVQKLRSCTDDQFIPERRNETGQFL